jgi:hypothetical protein
VGGTVSEKINWLRKKLVTVCVQEYQAQCYYVC